VIFIEVPGTGTGDDTVLLYGHLDKQPEMSGWWDGFGPWKPVIKDDKLYGRGGADDGYAIYGSIAALKALADQKIPHARCVILIEACEESGSYDLPHYIDHLAGRIGSLADYVEKLEKRIEELSDREGGLEEKIAEESKALSEVKQLLRNTGN